MSIQNVVCVKRGKANRQHSCVGISEMTRCLDSVSECWLSSLSFMLHPHIHVNFVHVCVSSPLCIKLVDCISSLFSSATFHTSLPIYFLVLFDCAPHRQSIRRILDSLERQRKNRERSTLVCDDMMRLKHMSKQGKQTVQKTKLHIMLFSLLACWILVHNYSLVDF